MALKVRTARVTDLPRLSALHFSAFGELGFTLDESKELFLKEDYTVFVMEDENEVIGFSAFTNDIPELYLNWIMVQPQNRHQKAGHLLITETESWGRERGLRRFIADARMRFPDSLKFYEASGFKKQGTFFGNDGDLMVRFSKPIA